MYLACAKPAESSISDYASEKKVMQKKKREKAGKRAVFPLWKRTLIWTLGGSRTLLE
jgi:hypothetical protein